MKERKTTKGTTHHKCTDGELTVRINQIYELLLIGEHRQGILRYCTENWQISERMVDQYIAMANEKIEAWSDKQTINSLKKSIARRDMLLRRAIQKGEHQVALEILKDKDKLLSNYPDERTRHILEGKVQTEDVKAPNLSDLPTDVLMKVIEKITNGNDAQKS